MKLSYKIISLLLLLVTFVAVIAVTPVSVMAAGSPTLSMENMSVKCGEQIEVKVFLNNTQSVCGGNFTLKYDSSLLTVESFDYGSIVNGYTKNCNLDYQSSGNLIRFTFSGSTSLSLDGTLVTFTFKSKAEGKANLDFTAYKMYDENGNAVSATAVSSVVTIQSNYPQNDAVILDIEDQSVKVGEIVTVPVVISEAASVFGGNFTLKYDSSLLNVESFDYGSIVNGYTKNCNLDFQSSGNLIRFTFSGSTPLSSDGTLVTFTFGAKAEGKANLNFTAYKMYDENGSSVEASVVDGAIQVLGPANSEEDAATVIINGLSYSVKVGDTITYDVYLRVDESISAVQVTITYDKAKLSVVPVADEWYEERELSCPNLNGTILNTGIPGVIKFNSTSIERNQFIEEKLFATFKFTVVDSGYSEIDLCIEEMAPYFSYGVPVVTEGIVIKELISKPDSFNCILGDANGDGKVNVKDATEIQKAVAGLLTLDETEEVAADVDSSGKVNVKDATAIQKWVAGIETGFLIGEPVKKQ